jgi:hypothetical protein
MVVHRSGTICTPMLAHLLFLNFYDVSIISDICELVLHRFAIVCFSSMLLCNSSIYSLSADSCVFFYTAQVRDNFFNTGTIYVVLRLFTCLGAGAVPTIFK